MASLKADGTPNLGAGVLTAKQIAVAGIQTEQMSSQSLAGDGSKISGASPLPSSCPQGQVVRGVDGDGKVMCIAGGALGSDGLEQVSGSLLSTKAGGPVSSANTPIAISDNNPIGTVDEVVVPDLGKAQALTVSVHLSNSDLSGIELLLYDPNNALYALHKGKSGVELNERLRSSQVRRQHRRRQQDQLLVGLVERRRRGDMIGGGGSCSRADRGIDVTEANAACFVHSNLNGEEDFDNNGQNYSDPYALNLWVR